MPAPITNLTESWSDAIEIPEAGQIWRVDAGAIQIRRSDDAATDGGIFMFVRESLDMPPGISVLAKRITSATTRVMRF